MAAPIEDVVCVSAEFSMQVKKIKCKKGQKISKGSIFCLYTNESTTTQKLKTCHGGVIKEILAKEGELKLGSPLYKVAICSHPTVMKDMCADCGSDLRLENSSAGKRKEQVSATVAMVHSIPELIVSEQLAQELGKADEDRLLKTRKLVLLVDLDQTLIHTTNDNIPANLKDVHRFQLWHGNQLLWYHTRLRPYTLNFLESIAKLYELHICTFGARMYAHTIAKILDPKGIYFSHRILSRDECFNASTKTANLKALFPCGDSMVTIIDDREDVWSFSPNLIHVKPYRFFQGTADINAPPGLTKTEQDRDPIIHRVRRVSQSSTNSADSNDNENDKNENTKFPSEEQMKEVEKIKLKRMESMEVVEEGSEVKEGNAKKNGKDCETITQNDDTTDKGKTENETDKTNDRNEGETEPEKTEEKTNKTSDTNERETETDKAGVDTDKTSDKNKGELKVDKARVETDKTSDKNEGETEADRAEMETDKTNSNRETEPNKEETNNKDESSANEINSQKEDIDVEEKNVEVKDQKEAIDDGQKNKVQSAETVVEDLKIGTKKQSDEKDESKNNGREEELVVWEDEDDYLFYLKEILENIHKTFYDMVDQLNVKDQPLKDKDKPNLKNIIPYMKRKVLKGCNLLFSGVIPTNMAPEKSRAYIVAKSLGANIHKDLITKENEKDPENFTTHLVAARLGTSKVRSALKYRKVSVVCVDWLWSCAERWERVEENLFPLQKSSDDRNCDSPDLSEMRKKTDLKRKLQAGEVGESDSKRVKTADNKGKQKKPGKGEEKDTFSKSYNPLFALSDDDLAYMDKEVEDEMESEGDASSEEDEDRDKRLRGEVLKDLEDSGSSSGDSLCGDMPRGWGLKKMSPKSSSSEDETKNPISTDNLGPEYESETDQDKFEKIMDAFGPDTENSDDDYQESIGSVDDELADAVEKEFLS